MTNLQTVVRSKHSFIPLSSSIIDGETGGLVSCEFKQWPPVTLAVSPCRSGSTVLLRLMGYAGIQSFFQPIKNALRWRLQGMERPWVVPHDVGPIFLKETFGPFLNEEVSFDPVADLLAAGLPADRLQVLIIRRNPCDVWSSWCTYWRDRTTIDLLAASYRACERTFETAQGVGIRVFGCEYDALMANGRTQFQRLFDRLGYAFSPDLLSGWDRHPAYGAPGSCIVHPEEPDAFVTPGVHDQALASSGVSGRKPPYQVGEPEVEQLHRSGVFETYRRLANLDREVGP